MPSIAGPILSSATIVPITLTYSRPYAAPACAPECILALSPAGVAYFDPGDAGFSASRGPLFIGSADQMTYTTQVAVSAFFCDVLLLRCATDSGTGP
jgi:hypothetical protein